MALQITGAAQIRLYWNLSGVLGINVLGARVTGNPTFAQPLAESLGSAMKSAFTTNLASSMTNGTQLVRVGVRDLRQPNLPEFRDTGALVSGTAAGEAMPPQVAACISLTTAKAGKSFRGRCYISGWGEVVNVAGAVAGASVGGGAVSFLTALNTVLTSNGMVLCVLSYPSEEKIITETTNHSDGTSTVRTLSHERARPGGTEPVTAITSRNTTWETQRRRANGRGQPPSSLDVVLSNPINLP